MITKDSVAKTAGVIAARFALGVVKDVVFMNTYPDGSPEDGLCFMQVCGKLKERKFQIKHKKGVPYIYFNSQYLKLK